MPDDGEKCDLFIILDEITLGTPKRALTSQIQEDSKVRRVKRLFESVIIGVRLMAEFVRLTAS